MYGEDDAPRAIDTSNGDWFANNAPAPAGGFAAQLNALYQRYAQRDATPGELQAHQGNPGGIGAVETLLKTSGLTDRGAAPAAGAPGASGGPVNGDFKSWFLQLTGGKPPTPAELVKLAPILQQYGVSLAPNAQGVNGKIKLPTGQIIDVIEAAGAGGKAWQWLDGPGGGSSGAAPNPDQFGGAPAPYTSTPWTGGDYTPPPLPTELQTPFVAPTQSELEASAGYGSRLAAGLQGMNRSAAARGTVLSGGTQKALARYGQDYASNEYGNFYGQRLNTRQNAANEYGQAVNVGQGTYQNRFGAYQANNQRTLTDYLTNTQTRRNYETDLWGRHRDLYDGGLRASL
jgi:hypothetical protein